MRTKQTWSAVEPAVDQVVVVDVEEDAAAVVGDAAARPRLSSPSHVVNK